MDRNSLNFSPHWHLLCLLANDIYIFSFFYWFNGNFCAYEPNGNIRSGQWIQILVYLFQFNAQFNKMALSLVIHINYSSGWLVKHLSIKNEANQRIKCKFEIGFVLKRMKEYLFNMIKLTTNSSKIDKIQGTINSKAHFRLFSRNL